MRLELQLDLRRRKGFRVQVDVQVTAQALAIVGPSGSGKSTLLDAIAGIEPGARVVIDGDDLSHLPPHARALGHVTQDALLFPHLDVRENLLFSPRASVLGDVPEALDVAHLLTRMPRHLSGGERRRVALGRAILSRPRVLLLDEPFAGLDEARRREALALTDSVRRAYDLRMILVSHLADDVLALTDRALGLEHGRVVFEGPSESVLRGFDARVDNFFTATVSGTDRVCVDGLELSVRLPPDATGLVRLGCYAHDIVLATGAPTGLSARNVFPATVKHATEHDGTWLVELDRPSLRVLLTRSAVRELGLAPGVPVHAILKATSLSYLGQERLP